MLDHLLEEPDHVDDVAGVGRHVLTETRCVDNLKRLCTVTCDAEEGALNSSTLECGGVDAWGRSEQILHADRFGALESATAEAALPYACLTHDENGKQVRSELGGGVRLADEQLHLI